MENINLYKNYLRNYTRIIRSYSNIDHAAINNNLIAFIKTLPTIKSIGGYIAINNEVDISPALNYFLGANYDIALPKILSGNEMLFHKITSLNNLEKNKMLYEPQAHLPVIVPDLIIVPSLAISSNGTRIGYGLGFYDKYLNHNKKTTVTPIEQKFCYNFIPSEKHDVRIDYIVTEVKFHRS